MALAVLVAGWLVGSVPLAVMCGRLISGADRIGAGQLPRRGGPARYRIARDRRLVRALP